MGTQTFVLTDSDLVGKISEDGVIIEPVNRAQGFGVALKLENAVALAHLILRTEAMLAEEQIGLAEVHPMA